MRFDMFCLAGAACCVGGIGAVLSTPYRKGTPQRGPEAKVGVESGMHKGDLMCSFDEHSDFYDGL